MTKYIPLDYANEFLRLRNREENKYNANGYTAATENNEYKYKQIGG